MKIDQIPDLYIEQYLLNELPENLRREIDTLIQENPSLADRIEMIKKSDEDILSAYPAESIISAVIEKKNRVESAQKPSYKSIQMQDMKTAASGIFHSLISSLQQLLIQISSSTVRRYTLSLVSTAMLVIAVFFIIPGVRTTDNIIKGYDTDVRIKGLESKLIIYRMKGKEIEELKNSDTAHSGDIIQLGYIAMGKFRYGSIISIDGRGAVTLHYPESTASGNELTMNKKILLNKSYELDDSPSFERFIMILSVEPVNISEIIEKAKKLAMNSESSLNGSIDAGKDSIEFSAVIKKIE